MDETTMPVDSLQAKAWAKILDEYQSARSQTTLRIKSSENWWKLHNAEYEREQKPSSHKSRSAWLHNVIASKHADGMEAYPKPTLLPREPSDKQEAEMLSAIIPCILEQNDFEDVYSDALWQKLKNGTGVYKVVWDPSKLNGLGDISVLATNVLNIYWEPGIKDIQDSRYVFQTELVDKDILIQRYPELGDRLSGQTISADTYKLDDAVQTDKKAVVVEVYYKKDGVLHYAQFVDDVVLRATENEPEFADGLYQHGMYPYVFDPLFPIEGSPCGYGFVDLCRSPQTQIDLLNDAFLDNAMVGAKPRYFKREGANINAEEFLDTDNPFVNVGGNLDDIHIRPIEYSPLDGNYLNVQANAIDELRQTSGNTETATGTTNSGVTAASAIAALQEASGKTSRDATRSAYRAYSSIIEMCVELIRQFYTTPRRFRITGEFGMEQYTTYSNAGLQDVPYGEEYGTDMGMRKPVFDIKISAQKSNAFTTMAQNELAIQFFNLGFFNPQNVDQAVLCLDMMEFEGKAELITKLQRNGDLFQRLLKWAQMALALAAKYEPDMADALSQQVMQDLGTAGPQMAAGMAKPPALGEDTRVANARSRAGNVAQPGGGM